MTSSGPTSTAQKALGHIRVLDLSRVLAGPWCSQNLADLGADVICAAPDYVARHGRPSTVAELEAHQCVILHAVARWPLVVDGVLQRRRVNARVTTSSVEAVRTAALQGLGLAMLAYWDVHAHLETGALIRIDLADAAMEDLSVWAVTPTRHHTPARVKVFLDALGSKLAQLASQAGVR